MKFYVIVFLIALVINTAGAFLAWLLLAALGQPVPFAVLLLGGTLSALLTLGGGVLIFRSNLHWPGGF